MSETITLNVDKNLFKVFEAYINKPKQVWKGDEQIITNLNTDKYEFTYFVTRSMIMRFNETLPSLERETIYNIEYCTDNRIVLTPKEKTSPVKRGMIDGLFNDTEKTNTKWITDDILDTLSRYTAYNAIKRARLMTLDKKLYTPFWKKGFMLVSDFEIMHEGDRLMFSTAVDCFINTQHIIPIDVIICGMHTRRNWKETDHEFFDSLLEKEDKDNAAD